MAEPLTEDDWKRTGVYCLRNCADGKQYVGSATKSFRQRYGIHRKSLKAGKHHSVYLQRAWDKYGESFFEFLVLEFCSSERCLAREQYWMDRLQTANSDYGYNILPTAGSRYGSKFSEESKAKMSAAKKGKPLAPEHLENLRMALKASNKGRKLTEEHKAKISAAKAGRPGKKLSKNTRIRMSLAKLGKKLSSAHSLKISLAHKRRGVKPSEACLRAAAEARRSV